MFRFDARSVGALSIAVMLFAVSAAHAQSLDTLSFDQKLRLAKAGDEEAQIAIARAYENGTDVTADEAQAATWYRKAANHGNPVAMYGLARILSKGALGIEKSPELAAKFYEVAARQGHVEAQNWLGYCYHHGLGIEQSDASAVAWYTRAADSGLAAAQNNLGLMYLIGKGVQRDYGRAAALFEQAANNGDAWGANNLGGLYEMGWGVKQDWQKARTYYNQASERGSKAAAENFRRMSAALGYPIAADVEPTSASRTTDKAEKPSVLPPANRDLWAAPPSLKAQAASVVERVPAQQPKRAKTQPRAKRLAKSPGQNQRTSKKSAACRTSFFERLFGAHRCE